MRLPGEPIRLLHTGDLHVPEGPRFEDVVAALTAMVADGREQNVDVWALVGDFTGTTVPHRMTIAERNAMADLVLAMAASGPVVMVRGNHDADGDLAIFARLAGAHDILVVDEEPALLADVVPGLDLLCLPYPTRRQWLGDVALGLMAGEEANRAASARVLERLRELAGQSRDGQALALLAHATVVGASVTGWETMAEGKEVQLHRRDMQGLGLAYCGFSHIHRRQELWPGGWYAGSPTRSTYGETDEKGYLIVDLIPWHPAATRVHVRASRARPFVTLDAMWTEDGWYVEGFDAESTAVLNGVRAVPMSAGGPPLLFVDAVRDAEVRLRVAMPEESRIASAPAVLRERVFAAGAVDVQLEVHVIPTQRVRSEAARYARTLAEHCRVFWASQGESAPEPARQEGALRKLEEVDHAD